MKEDLHINWYTPEPNQEKVHLDTARFRVVCAGRKFGKALAVNTPILTDVGWKVMGDIKKGDVVFDEEGSPTTVLETTGEMHDRQCYRITFSDETEIVADASHEWFTWTKWARKAYQRAKNPTIHPSVKTTEEIARTVKIGLKRENNHAIQVCGALKYPERDLPIAPYLLGIWLGDGTSRGAEITTSDLETIEEIKGLGYEIRKKTNEKYTYRVYNLQHIMRKLALLQNKHIPIEYFSASEKQRLELLRGLMDSDGTIGKRGYCSFDNMNETLVNQVRELLNGLGQKSMKYEKVARLYEKNCGICHRLYFAPTIRPFNLTRKIKRLKDSSPRRDFRYIKQVEKVASVAVKCIEVDSSSSLYLATKSLIPTHNSVLARQELMLQAINYKGKRKGGIYQPANFWIISPTIKQGKLNHWRQLVMEIPRELIKNINKTELTIELVNGSFIHILGAENADKIRGAGVVGMVIDEAAFISSRIWEMVLEPELLSTKGWALFISTPAGYNWYEEVYRRGIKGTKDYDKDWSSFKFTSYETPRAQDDETKKHLQRIQNRSAIETFAQEYLADFTKLEGLIYKEFTKKYHLIDPIDIPKEWEHYRAIDWGAKDPTAVLFFAVDPEGHIYLYDEIYETDITTTELAEKLKSRSYGKNIVNTFADPSGRQNILNLQQEHQIPVVKATRETSTTRKNWVNLGIDLVKEKFRGRLEDGVPVLQIFNNCDNTIKELQLYSWKENPDPDKNSPGVPEDANDHAMDAMRYFIVSYAKGDDYWPEADKSDWSFA